jgi:hypothetical protein
VHVQPDVVGRSVKWRNGFDGGRLRGQRRNVQVGADREARDQHVA